MLAIASAQGVLICIHENGTSRLENEIEQQRCAADHHDAEVGGHDQASESHLASATDRDCIDVPLPVMDRALQAVLHHHHVAAFYPIIDLPPVLQVFAFPLLDGVNAFGDSGFAHSPRTDATLNTLSGIVLVI